MDKRYQVFVSSTFADLQDERRAVLQTLMEMDCIPAGMELFPAADEEQWHFIKRVIDDCDYYLLIVGGRYGSLTPDGVSYTEKEYNYAVERGLKVIALLHGNPGAIPAAKTEDGADARIKLGVFRDKVAAGRLVKFWTSAGELPGLVALSLAKTIKMYPAVGWVRASAVATTELLEEVNLLRKRNDELTSVLARMARDASERVPGLAGVDESFSVGGHYRISDATSQRWNYTTTWREILRVVGPFLLASSEEGSVKMYLEETLAKIAGVRYPQSAYLDDDIFQTIKLQLVALGWIAVASATSPGGGVATTLSLSELGQQRLFELGTVKAAPRDNEA